MRIFGIIAFVLLIPSIIITACLIEYLERKGVEI